MKGLKTEITETIVKRKQDAQKLPEKRKRILRVTVLFFGVMFLLTVFNTNLQKIFLPQVAVSKPKSGNIYKKVRGSGLLEAGETKTIFVNGDKKITEILVSTGDVVKEGQALFVCESIEDEALKASEEELLTLEDEYKKELLDRSSEYGVDNLMIQDAREQLLLSTNRLEEVKQNKVNYDLYVSQISQKQEELTKMNEAYQKAKEALGEDSLIDNTELERAISLNETLLTQQEEKLEQLNGELADAVNVQNQELMNTLQSDIATVKQEMEELKAQIKADKQTLKENKKSNKNIQKLIDAVDSAKAKVDACQEEIDSIKEKQSEVEGKGIDVDEAKLDLNQKQIALNQLLLDEKKGDVDFNRLWQQLDDKREEINKKKQSLSSNEIISDFAGVVSELRCETGDVVTKEQGVAVIKPLQTGYKFSFEINKSLAEFVAVGDEAKVLNIWDDSVKCTLTNIKMSSEDPDKSLLLEFQAQGENLAIGQNIAVSVGETQSYYDLIVPISAVNEDNAGSFVFVLRTKNSAFGSRYYVERVGVELLASDETSAAVNGNLTVNDHVVIQSIEPLENFEKVRLVD